MLFTVFTPTYNRAGTLPRLYKSLINQSFKDYLWLIIDDGSTDNTNEIVSEWIKENKIKIKYQYKINGGKHTAMKLAFELIDTKYLIEIDSDDELTPDTIEVFRDEWTKIEKNELRDQFAEVSALSYSVDGKLIGNFYFPDGTAYIDSFWHEMALKYHNYNEHIVCWNVEKLKECVKIPEKFWLSDKINFFNEATLWARIGKKYKTRYINKKLRIYNLDGGESLLRMSDITRAHYNNIVGQKFFLDENLDYFFWNPKYFIHLIIKVIVSGIALKKSPCEIMNVMKTSRLRTAYIIFFPAGLLSYIYFKIIKPRFWF
jgi:glycosyltransferase involved in cell wall biosynthesis